MSNGSNFRLIMNHINFLLRILRISWITGLWRLNRTRSFGAVDTDVTQTSFWKVTRLDMRTLWGFCESQFQDIMKENLVFEPFYHIFRNAPLYIHWTKRHMMYLCFVFLSISDSFKKQHSKYKQAVGVLTSFGWYPGEFSL